MIKNDYNHDRLKYFTLVNQVDTNIKGLSNTPLFASQGLDGVSAQTGCRYFVLTLGLIISSLHNRLLLNTIKYN